MKLDPTVCYRALLARDERHDGRFFVCVQTTGIYCRPICPARPPKFENCRFVPTAAAAAEAGYRTCLRFRPECSPDTGLWQGTSATVSRGLRLIEEGALDHGDVESLATRLGIGERHLRRLFRQHVGATPIAVAQTRRALLAKQLIHHTGLSMTDVALASGFQSVRRFNETFRQMYGRSPAQLRRNHAIESTDTSEISLLLPYRPPYDWDALLDFLARRAIPGVERVCDQRYCRTIVIGGCAGMMQVANHAEQAALRVTVSIPRIDNLATIIARTRHLFDLRADSVAIDMALSQDPIIAPLVELRPGLRVPGGWDAFEIAVRAVLGQQISVDAATKLAGKLAESLGSPAPEALQKYQLVRIFPPPSAFRLDSVLAIGIPPKRAEAIVALAIAVKRNPHLFDPQADLNAAIALFRSLPGIGEWTAQYIAMRVLRESDAFLAGDAALQRILARGEVRPNRSQLRARAQAWRPWRAYATLHFWTSEVQSERINQGDQSHAVAI